MSNLKKNVFAFLVLLFMGICVTAPLNAYAAEASPKMKDMNLRGSAEPQEIDGLFAGMLTWTAVKGCSDYEIYRSDGQKDSELLATVSDGSCQYTDSDLQYQKRYQYMIYACKKSKGSLVKKYYDTVWINIELSYIEGCDDPPYFDSSASRISIYISPDSTCGVIQPDYIEVSRYNFTTGKTKKFEIPWSDFAQNNGFTDNTVKAGTTYNYLFQTCRVVNGKKLYYGESTFRITAYNLFPKYDVEITIPKTKNTDTMIVKLKSQKGNAPLIINKQSLDASVYAAKMADGRATLELKEISYDGKSWIPAKNNLYILLNEKETIYVKLKCTEGHSLAEIDADSSLWIFFPYLYDKEKDSPRRLLYYSGNFKNKKIKALEFDWDI